MSPEDGDVAFARLGKRHLNEFDAFDALDRADGEIIDAAEAERRNFQLAGIGARIILELLPGLEAAVLGDEDERRALEHDRHRRDLVNGPARILAGEQSVAVGNVNGGGIAIGWRGKKLGHPGPAGCARHVDHRNALPKQWFGQFADQARELVGAAAGPPRDNQLKRTFGIFGADRKPAEGCSDHSASTRQCQSACQLHRLFPNQPVSCGQMISHEMRLAFS